MVKGRIYKISDTQKKDIIKHLCDIGQKISILYTALDDKYSLEQPIKRDFSELSTKLSNVHALITKWIGKE